MPVVASRGALEGALGGQWIPDVPVAAPWGAKYAPLAAPVVAPYAAPFAAPWAAHVAAPVVATRTIAAPIVPAPLAYGWGAHGVVSKGALEGALGGQWIPDVLPEH